MNKKIYLIIILAVISSCAKKTTHPFIQKFKSHCGQSYIGETVFPDDPGNDFAGKTLLMEINQCNDKEVRVAFAVGENRSRTWIISNTQYGLLLKHDHRHKDGTPDEITMYGGYSNKKGSETKQFFEADLETKNLIPAASTNVWMMEFNDRNNEFVYYLERHQKPRYKAVFDLNKN